MLARIDLRGTPRDVVPQLPRARVDVVAALEVVAPLVEDVRTRGAVAVRAATERFDGVALDDLRVPTTALVAAVQALAPDVRAALKECVARTRAVHTAQLRAAVHVDVRPGLAVTERYVPLRRVGVYVPGGRVGYPSSVVMNVVPAQVAGVASIALASPPQPATGLPRPEILAAAALLGITEVYAVGGAQAVALLAYGAAADDRTASVEPVDAVSGPGNVYVAAAKRIVSGVVAVDAEAGPTEVAVLADETASPAFVAADLVAQAEHDPLAACLLVTTSSTLADAVDVELARIVPMAHHRDAVVGALTGQSAVVLVDDIDHGLAVVDLWAPEHLEVMTADADAVADRVRNAGAVFVGAFAPVSLGDYLAGSNHVLPTGGTAARRGGLSVDTFLRGVHVVRCDRDALAASADHIAALGGAEELPAHVAAVQVRLT